MGRWEGVPLCLGMMQGCRAADACMTCLRPGSSCPRSCPQVICCSGARTTLTTDLSRVDDVGVSNLAKAFMDELVRTSVHVEVPAAI